MINFRLVPELCLEHVGRVDFDELEIILEKVVPFNASYTDVLVFVGLVEFLKSEVIDIERERIDLKK